MTWNIEWDECARKELRKLDKTAQKKILCYLRERIATAQNPKRFGRALSYDKRGLWRYRVGNYRIICQIRDHELLVLVVKVAHRKKVYH